MTLKIKTKYIDAFLIFFAGVNAILVLLMQATIISSDYQLLVIILAGIFIFLEVLWRLVGKPSNQSEQANEILRVTLDHCCREFSTDEVSVRANVMTPQRKRWWCFCVKVLKIKYYSEKMKNDRDRTIQLDKWLGCAGQAWGLNKPLGAIFTKDDDPNFGEPQWILPPDITELLKDLKVILSIPIRHPDNNKIVGILNLDSTDDGAIYLLDDDNIEELKSISISISQILYELEQI